MAGQEQGKQAINRRQLFRWFRDLGLTAGVFALGGGLEWPSHLVEAAGEKGLPFTNGKYQTFPRSEVKVPPVFVRPGLLNERTLPVLHLIDIGTLGPDVDTIVGIDFPGDLPTGALEIHRPDGEVKETRVVFIKRVDLETVQLEGALGGDRFDVLQISEFGGDKALDEMARKHAKNTARKHQKVVYLGDLGLFEKQWGANEKEFLSRIIRAQRPGNADLNLPEPNFVNPRNF